MKIVYIHQYFKTYTDGSSTRSYYLAKALVDQGFEVEVITSHNEKTYRQTTIEGIHVHYLPVFYDTRLGFWSRIQAFLFFIWKAYRLASRLPNVDLCYATSTPLTIGLIALLLKWRKKLPFYFEVRDLWPLAPVQLGVIRNRWLQKIAFRLEKKIYQEAEQLIALSPGIAAYIEHCTAYTKPVTLLPNISDCSFFNKEKKEKKYLTRYQVEGKFVVTYFGAVGKVNALESLLEIARLAQYKGFAELAFLIVGRGNRWNELQQLAATYQLKNVQFIPHLSKYELREVLNVTDAVYVSFETLPVLETSSPNKFFDALAAGKLCISNTQGWIKELVESEACGFYAHPDHPEEFMDKVASYLTHPDLLETGQTNARHLAEQRFSRTLLTRQFLTLFPKTTPLRPVSENLSAVAEPI